MTKTRTAWTPEDIIIAFALYCVTPLTEIKVSNPVITRVSTQIGHSVSSLTMRMQNFRFLDPSAEKGLQNVAKKDKEIYEDFRHDWGALSSRAEELTGLSLFDAGPINGAKRISALTARSKVNSERAFFRKAVLASYDYSCCISGMHMPSFLVASHIKPYRNCDRKTERVNPENGLCLNIFYDKAFDLGLITVDKHLRVWVAQKALTAYNDDFTTQWLHELQGESITLPTRFRPGSIFLEYHNDKIFRG